MSKAKAPRRKVKDPVPPKEMRGTKLTVAKRICNDVKWAVLEPMFDRACALKNTMSAYVHGHLLGVLVDAYQLKADYKVFDSPDLNAWERQALFHDIVGDYQKSLTQQLKARPFRVQKTWSYQTYKRAVNRTLPNGQVLPVAVAGQVKAGTFVLSYRTTVMTSLANYLLRVNIALFDPERMDEEHALRADFLRVQQDGVKWSMLKRVARQRQVRLISRQGLAHYVTGTFRVSPAQSGTAVVIDASNTEHKLWLKIRLGLDKEKVFIHLPLQVSQGRLRHIVAGDIAKLGLATEFRLKLTANRKLHVCAVYEAKPLVFVPEQKSLGLDLNTKRAFANDHAGGVYQLDQLVLAAGLTLLARIDAEGGVAKMGYRRAAQLRQWLRSNEAHIKKKLSAWCAAWQEQQVTDIWLEDLAMSGDATMLRHPTLDAQKYSRVLRLLRLSAVKDWLFSIAEKRGMRVHTTDPAYSSQECPACHHVARANRPSQAVFQCVECGFAGDADQVAGINLNNRGSEKLRAALHITDRHGRCSPRPIRRVKLKALLMAQKSSLDTAGGVTELLTPASTTKPGAAKTARSSRSSIQKAT